MYYIIDTNIWIDVGRGKLQSGDLQKPGVEVALAPLTIVELMTGVIKGGEPLYPKNKSLFELIVQTVSSVLELPKVFVFGVIWNINIGSRRVHPTHYEKLINLLIESHSLKDFLRRTEEPGSVWKRFSELYSIHEGVLNRELGSLTVLADQASIEALHINLAKLCSLSGLVPDPEWFQNTFSAAVEFTRSSVAQVKNGANPQKNNRGMYMDSQLFWYLGDPDAVVVSREDFSDEIRKSPQKSRIISLERFLTLTSTP